MPDLRIRIDDKQVQKALGDLASKQIPYATAVALNDLAFQVQRAERANMQSTFTSPRPFTVRSVLVDKADKHSLTATVYVRPEVAKYLQPYETGGMHVLPGKGIARLEPVDIGTDQYGQLRRGTTARLKGRKTVFVGSVQTKAGIVNGFWQRLATKTGSRIKLLVRFGDNREVQKHLGFEQRARQTVAQGMAQAFAAALARVTR